MKILDLANGTIDDLTISDLESYFILIPKEKIKAVCNKFNVDDRTVNDGWLVDSTIKYEDFGTYQFISLAIPEIDINDEFNIYIGPNFCFFVYPENHNNNVVNYIKNQIHYRINTVEAKLNVTYTPVYYASIIIDTIISKYFEIVTSYESKIERFLDEILVKPGNHHFELITNVRNEVYTLKKDIRAIDNINIMLCLEEAGLIKKAEYPAYKNISTRIRGLLKFIESVYSLSSELMHSYDTKIANQTNSLVTRLTVITIIMGVWTVVVGVYGMNFKNMPETEWAYSYYIVIGGLIVITFILIWFFHKKKWI